MWCKHPRDTRRPPANQENERTTGPFVVQIRVQTRCKGVQRCKPGQPRRPGATPLDEAAARRSPSPPAQHLHQHRHHAADDSPGAGADRGNPLLLAGLLRAPALQRPDPAGSLLACRYGNLSSRHRSFGKLPRCSTPRRTGRRCEIGTSRTTMISSPTRAINSVFPSCRVPCISPG
jgi:hypothetical protein